MNIEDKKYLCAICKCSQPYLKKYLIQRLRRMGKQISWKQSRNKHKFIYAPGTVPVLLIAHLDTVHTELIQEIYLRDERYLSSPQGIGGDDRCGVYMVLKILERLDCHVLFVTDEEIGCIGAAAFVKEYANKDLGINYMIEFDRKGETDSVFYDCDNKDFEKFINATGYFKTAQGILSDISVIAPALKIAAVNLSSGYYRAHTTMEYIDTEVVETNIEEAIKVIQQPSEKFIYVAAERYVGYYNYNLTGGKYRNRFGANKSSNTNNYWSHPYYGNYYSTGFSNVNPYFSDYEELEIDEDVDDSEALDNLYGYYDRYDDSDFDDDFDEIKWPGKDKQIVRCDELIYYNTEVYCDRFGTQWPPYSLGSNETGAIYILDGASGYAILLDEAPDFMR